MAVTATATELVNPMYRCLRTPELVTRICDEADKPSALALALTCRGFLETGLDSRWRHLTSFGPLVACLPEDLLEERDLESQGLPSKMKTFRRALRASDLQRYLEFYATRIRSFRPHPQKGKIWLSIEALQAMQLITNYKPGVLSPRLKAFQLTPPGTRTLSYLEDGFADRLALCMALFVHRTATRMEFSSFYDCPLYNSAVEAFTSWNSNLEQLVIRVHRDYHPSWRWGVMALDRAFLQQYLTTSLWSNLKELAILDGGAWAYLAEATIQHLSSLPRLTDLILDGPAGCHPPDHAPPTHDSFPCLRRITLQGGSNIQCILRSLPATNRVASVNCHDILWMEEQQIFAAIGMHCNPSALKELRIKGRSVDWPPFCHKSEAIEPFNNSGDVDIEPILQFSLEFVNIRVSGPIQVTPAQIELLCTRWRSATCIHLFSQASMTSNPSIDHAHLIMVAKHCPALLQLGLRFDASRIKGDTMIPGFDHARPLRTIYVGGSPIYSPAAVLRFLGIVFPSLEAVGYQASCEWETPIYKSRWNAVADRFTAMYEPI